MYPVTMLGMGTCAARWSRCGSRSLTIAIQSNSIVCEEFGESDVMKMGSKQLPKLAEGQVLVQMKAAGVNPSDTYMRLGPKGPWAATPHLLPALPFTPGKDGAGVLQSVGEGVDVSRFKGTDRVYTLDSVTGTYSDYAICNATDVFPLPNNVSFVQGACVGVPCGTAFRALKIRCPVERGDQVFIHGASGAVGVAATQIAKNAGCFVVGTAGSEAGMKTVREAGADIVLNHRVEGYLDEAAAKSDCGNGFDVCLEMMASSNLAADLPIMKKHGRVGIIGSKALPIEINPRALMATELDVRGIFMPCCTLEEVQSIHAGLYDLLSAGALSPIVVMELPLSEAARAHVEVMSPTKGGASGNIALIVE